MKEVVGRVGNFFSSIHTHSYLVKWVF